VGNCAEVGALFTAVSSIRVSRVSRVSVMVSVRASLPNRYSGRAEGLLRMR